jgi:hypothetical protein
MNADRGRRPPPDESRWRQLSAAGMRAKQAGQYAEAEQSLCLAVQAAERLGGFYLADSFNVLGSVYVCQGAAHACVTSDPNGGPKIIANCSGHSERSQSAT